MLAVSTLFTDSDFAEFLQGRLFCAHEKLGAHPLDSGSEAGVNFAVWAPGAHSVSVIGDFNHWDRFASPMRLHPDSGIWELACEEARRGDLYKFHIEASNGAPPADRRDPYATELEPVSGEASRIAGAGEFAWSDSDWMLHRNRRNSLGAPVSIYEVHPGSWRRVPEEGDRRLRGEEFAELLAGHAQHLGFTHVALVGVLDQPEMARPGFEAETWFSPDSRFAGPDGFERLVDTLHQREIGVLLDFPAGGFSTGGRGLEQFDGSALYEDLDAAAPPGCRAFRITRPEVRSYLISSALYWLGRYHLDGLRVSGVDWLAGGPERSRAREAAAREFLRTLNHAVHGRHQAALMMSVRCQQDARDSSGGHSSNGFSLEEDCAWSAGLLDFLSGDSGDRTRQPDRIAELFSIHEAARRTLAVPRGKPRSPRPSPAARMPGDEWQRFANLRLLYGCQMAQPGKKLLFMGSEFGQYSDWSLDQSLDWHLLQSPYHRGLQLWIHDLNRLYVHEPALHEKDCRPGGMEWIEPHDPSLCVSAFLRRGRRHGDVLVVCNFLPVPRAHYPIGVSEGGDWQELLNSDAVEYGGSGVGNLGRATAVDLPRDGQPCTLVLTLPPLGILFLRRAEPDDI